MRPETLRGEYVGELKDLGSLNDFVFGGSATFTLVSKRTGDWITYHVRRPENFGVFLVTYKGDGEWPYLGSCKPGQTHVAVGKSTVGKRDTGRRVFDWFLRHLAVGDILEGMEVWHDGTCGMCGRALTHPESIQTGLGPVCRGKKNSEHKVF